MTAPPAPAAAALTAAPLPILLLEHVDEWAAWLDAHHETARGAWLRLARKAAALRAPSYAEAVDAALCYGWVDSLARRHDDRSWVQKFTPRSARSRWSPANRAKVETLAAAGHLRPAGRRAVEQAKAAGRWDAVGLPRRSPLGVSRSASGG